MLGLATTAKLKAAQDAALQMRIERDNARTSRKIQEAAATKFGRLANEVLRERDAAYEILREIEAMATANCAHIGRKMAAKAREGLPEYAVIASEQVAA